MAAILLGTETETATLQVVSREQLGDVEIYVDGPDENDPSTILTLSRDEARTLRDSLNLLIY